MKPSHTMNTRMLHKFLAAAAAAALLSTPAALAAEKLVADIRADFPSEGEKFQQPEWKNGWVYYVARAAEFSEPSVMTWWHDAEKWPDGLLSAFNTGNSAASIARNRDDAIVVTPGDDEKWLVARWVSNTKGNLRVRGTFRRLKSTPELTGDTDGIEFMIRHMEGDNLFSGISEAVNDTAEKEFDLLIPEVGEGDPVDFIIRGIKRNWGNETQITAQILVEQK